MDAQGDTFCLEGLCTPSLLLKELMVVYLIFPNSGLFEKRLEGHSQVFVAVELEVF